MLRFGIDFLLLTDSMEEIIMCTGECAFYYKLLLENHSRKLLHVGTSLYTGLHESQHHHTS